MSVFVLSEDSIKTRDIFYVTAGDSLTNFGLYNFCSVSSYIPLLALKDMRPTGAIKLIAATKYREHSKHKMSPDQSERSP